MDIEKLIERLKAKDFERDYDCTPFECGVFGLLDDAATALSTLQAENEKLRAKLEKAERERNGAVNLLKLVNDKTGNCYGCKYFDIAREVCTEKGKKFKCDCGKNNFWEYCGTKEK